MTGGRATGPAPSVRSGQCLGETERCVVGAGFLFIFVPLFLYLTPMTLLCVKIADRNSWKMGLVFASGLIFLPAVLVTGWILVGTGVL